MGRPIRPLGRQIIRVETVGDLPFVVDDDDVTNAITRLAVQISLGGFGYHIRHILTRRDTTHAEFQPGEKSFIVQGPAYVVLVLHVEVQIVLNPQRRDGEESENEQQSATECAEKIHYQKNIMESIIKLALKVCRCYILP